MEKRGKLSTSATFSDSWLFRQQNQKSQQTILHFFWDMPRITAFTQKGTHLLHPPVGQHPTAVTMLKMTHNLSRFRHECKPYSKISCPSEIYPKVHPRNECPRVLMLAKTGRGTYDKYQTHLSSSWPTQIPKWTSLTNLRPNRCLN